MKTVIIYGSCYGTSERYARELARQTGAELHAAKDLRDLTGLRPGSAYRRALCRRAGRTAADPAAAASGLLADGCHSGAGGPCPS